MKQKLTHSDFFVSVLQTPYTLRKAITYGKLVEGVDVCKFGKQWVVSTEAMKREYGEPRI